MGIAIAILAMIGLGGYCAVFGYLGGREALREERERHPQQASASEE